MRIVVNRNIGEIVTAIYYKSPAMPIGSEDLYSTLDAGTQAQTLTTTKAQEIRYDSGELGVDYRFFEYGLQYFPEPDGILPTISSGLANELFRNEDGDWIGTGDFKHIGKYIIPSNAANDSVSGLKFFGSFQTSTQRIYTFPAGPGISKIDLYDTSIDPSEISRIYDYDLGYGDFRIQPAISIYLGCTADLESTPRWSEHISERVGGPDLTRDLDYILYSERYDSKVVFLAIGQRKEKNLQISYNAWLKLYEPLRNKPEYDVLKDERYNDPEQTGETLRESYFDLASGTYLGDKDERKKPILTEKLKEIKEGQYSRWKRYGPGDTVMYSGKAWTSLCSDNCGNIPGFSTKWVLSECTTNFYTSWFTINCPEAKRLDPGIKINVPDYQKESMFKLYPKPGYIPNEAVVRDFDDDEDISRVVMTENIDVDEERYYAFYIKWDATRKSEGAIRGKVVNLSLEPKPLSPVLRSPSFIVQKEGGRKVCTWGTALSDGDTLSIPGGDIVIDNQLNVSILPAIPIVPGADVTQLEANEAFRSLLGKIKFSLDYIKSIPGSTWGPGKSEVEPWVKIEENEEGNLLSDIILHEDKVDYETCTYILIPEWNYKKVTVSNSGDFDIEYPVLDVIRTEDFMSGVFSRYGLSPSELMIKYQLEGEETWSEWNHAPFRGGLASWNYNDNVVTLTLDPTDSNYYDLKVQGVTMNLIIDIKV